MRIEGFLAMDGDMAAVLVHADQARSRLYRWNLREDAFEPGNWLEARIPEGCSDVSANGRLFAYPMRQEGRAVVAVSRAPFLLPLATWPCRRNTSGARFLGKGGLVVDTEGRRPVEGSVPGWFDVNVHRISKQERLDRSGWEPPKLPFLPKLVAFSEEELWKPFGKGHLVRRGDRYLIDGYFTIDLYGAAWADVDHRGRLVYSRGAELRAIDPATGSETVLHDFGADIEDRVPPAWAHEWLA